MLVDLISLQEDTSKDHLRQGKEAQRWHGLISLLETLIPTKGRGKGLTQEEIIIFRDELWRVMNGIEFKGSQEQRRRSSIIGEEKRFHRMGPDSVDEATKKKFMKVLKNYWDSNPTRELAKVHCPSPVADLVL